MDKCRNCGVVALRDLGFTGIIAPFFLKRVMRAELAVRQSADPRKQAIQRLTGFASRMFTRIHPPAVVIELQSCLNCSYIQAKYPFPDDALGRLYSDYRSDSYTCERIHYEPSYATIADKMGDYVHGSHNRVESLTAWLAGHIHLDQNAAILDYGGADGRFLPSIPGRRYVFEISDVKPVRNVTRIADESSLATYDYVQIAHMLEHVSSPLAMVRRVSSLLKPGGYLLIEVPQDTNTETLREFQAGRTKAMIDIHEHICRYSALAVEKLIEASGLETVVVEAIPVESPVSRQFFIRGLARRPASSAAMAQSI